MHSIRVTSDRLSLTAGEDNSHDPIFGYCLDWATPRNIPYRTLQAKGQGLKPLLKVCLPGPDSKVGLNASLN